MNESDRPDPRRRTNRRGFRWDRCPGCLLPKESCICRARPTLEAAIDFWLFFHPEEMRKPTNTGKLIADCFPATRVTEWTRIPTPADWEASRQNDDVDVFIVFPDDYPPRESRFVPFPTEERSGRRRTFLLLDGTWQQARKMLKRSAYLDEVPIVGIDPDFHSTYGLRHASDPHRLCTAEVGVALLEEAGEQRAAELFRSYFRLFDLQYRIARFGPGSVGVALEERDHLLEWLPQQKQD